MAQGWITATHEDSLLGTAGAGETESVTTNANVVRSWAFATPANEPNSTNWPSGTYRAQLDCTAASAGLVYGMTAVPDDGPFARLTSNLASLVSGWYQSEAAFSGTGLKLGTQTQDPAAGNADETYSFGVVADVDDHADAITLRFSADAFADGPWPDLFSLLLQRSEPTERSQSASVWINF